MVATLLPHTSISTDAFVELEALQFFSHKSILKALLDALKIVQTVLHTFYISFFSFFLCLFVLRVIFLTNVSVFAEVSKVVIPLCELLCGGNYQGTITVREGPISSSSTICKCQGVVLNETCQCSLQFSSLPRFSCNSISELYQTSNQFLYWLGLSSFWFSFDELAFHSYFVRLDPNSAELQQINFLKAFSPQYIEEL